MEILFKYINYKAGQLKKSAPTFQSLFNIIHDQGDRIFAEYIKMFEIKTVSYKQLKEYCYQMATYLQKKLTAPKQSFVGLYMDNSINWVATFWALLMIGYKPLLLNTKLPININNEIITTMKVQNVVVCKEHASIAFVIQPLVLPTYEEIKNQELLTKENWADEMAICTTASSMNYKICVYTGKNMHSQLLNSKSIIGESRRIKRHYKKRLKLLAFLPFYHIFGFVATYLWFSLFGRTMVFLENYSAETILSTIRKCEVTHIFSIPMFWNIIAKEITKQVNRLDAKKQKQFKKAQKLSLAIQNIWPALGITIARKIFNQVITSTLGNSIRFLITGGGYISDSTLYLLNSVGYPLVNGYGTSEVGIICVELRRKPKYIIQGSVGKPLETVDVKVENNHVLIKGLSTCDRYYYKDGKCVSLNNTWFDTLDVGSFKHRHLFIQGRLDDVIVGHSGEKINPDLLEKQLQFTYATNYVITSYQHKPTLIIQVPKHKNVYILDNVVNEVNANIKKLERLGYQIEAVYYTYDDITPPNAIKVSRKILAKLIEDKKVELKQYSDLTKEVDKSDNETTNQVILVIKKIFGCVLNKDPSTIGNNQHFFLELGGTSIDYCTCFAKIEEEFDITLDLTSVKCVTVQEFSEYIINAKKGQ